MRWSRRIASRWHPGAALLIVLATAGVSVAFAGEPAAVFHVVVHPESAATAVSREFLADAFLARAKRWPDGEAIRAVDLRFDSPARAHFSQQILRRSVFAVRSFWQQRIFAGRGVPPPELDSDEAVLRYVSSRRGAIGYVSSKAATASVKVVSVR